MVRGETYDKQLFESEAFRHFINIFLNKQSGVTKGCELSKNLQSIVIGTGSFVIQGGFLKEVTGTENEIPSEAGYYKLVYEIDLSKTNTKDEFKQGNYKFVKALGDYPQLIQEDLDNDGNIYQLPFCQFRMTESGLQDFKDLREFIEYGIYQKKGTALYKNETGTTEIVKKIPLKDDVNNYDYIDITVTRAGQQTTHTSRIYKKDYDKRNSLLSVSTGSYFTIFALTIALKNTEISIVSGDSISFSDHIEGFANGIESIITDVIGYK